MVGGCVLKGLSLPVIGLFLVLLISGDIHADTTYVIKKGDNPWSLAKKYKVSADKLISVNGLKADHLKPGTRIRIPSQKKGRPSKGKIAKIHPGKVPGEKVVKSVREDASEVTTLTKSSVHIVRKGDTLFSISREHSLSPSYIKALNHLRTHRIKVGQKLIVTRGSPERYTVRKGDTVWRIAKRFGLGPDKLREMNGLHTDSLQLGQKLIVAAITEGKCKPDGKGPKAHRAVLSQARLEDDIEQISTSEEISELGMHERVSLFAKKMLDIPYRFGGNTLFGIDCSAYVKKVYSMIGVDLPRSAREQFHEGTPVDGEPLTIGDLVFFRTYASFPSHVGIYMGNNLFIHASSRSKKVTIDSLDTPYYLKRFIGAKRLLDANDTKEAHEKEG